jgi:hypothetical protein
LLPKLDQHILGKLRDDVRARVDDLGEVIVYRTAGDRRLPALSSDLESNLL